MLPFRVGCLLPVRRLVQCKVQYKQTAAPIGVSPKAKVSDADKKQDKESFNDGLELQEAPPRRVSALDKVDSTNLEIVDRIRPTIKQSFNLAAYINSSDTLQELLKLKIDLSKLDRFTDLATYLVKADFQKDIQPYIDFLLEAGVQQGELGKVLNRNPFLLTINLDDLNVRKNYFLFRKFSKTDIATIFLNGSNIFSFDTKTIDTRLGFLLDEYQLQPSELRHVVVRYPPIIGLEAIRVKKCTFMFQEEMGFTKEETKLILTKLPSLWVRTFIYSGHDNYVAIFDYLHSSMGISHELISNTPTIFLRRLPLIKARHQYLKTLKRAQYDPTKPLFVPLTAFYAIDDNEFCVKYAKTSSADFNAFLKTL